MAGKKDFDAYHLWLGIPPQRQPPDHYRLLGLSPLEANADVISNAADQRMAHVRSLQAGEHADAAHQLLNEISQARLVLLNPAQKKAYDRKLRGAAASGANWRKPNSRAARAGEQPLPSPESVPGSPAASGAQKTQGPLPVAQPLTAASPPPRKKKPDAAAPIVDVKVSDGESSGKSGAGSGLLFAGLAVVVLVLGGLVVFGGGLTAWFLWSDSETVADVQSPTMDLGSDTDANGKKTPIQIPPPPPIVSDPIDAVDDGTAQPANGQQNATPATDPDSSSHTAIDNPPTEPPAASPLAPERIAPPSQDEQQKVLTQLDDLYPAEEVKTAEQQSELAREFLQMGGDKQAVPLERYVLLRRAAELSSQAGDVAIMSQSISRMAEDFDIDSVSVEGALLARMASRGHYQGNAKPYVEHAAELADDAVELDRYDVAQRVLSAVLSLPPSLMPPAQRDGLQRSLASVNAQQELYTAVQEAERAIAIDASDADAHYVLARWYCFTKDDWPRGIVHLASSSHSQLQAVAAAEIATDTGATAGRFAAGDLWWDAAQAADESLQPPLYARSNHWYRQVTAASLGGLDRYKLQKRIEELDERFGGGPSGGVAASGESDDRFVALFSKGVAAVREKRFGDADRYFSHCIRVNPDSADAISNYALTGLRVGQSQRAIRQWQRLIDEGTAMPELTHNLERTRTLVKAGEIPLDRNSAGELDTMIAAAKAAAGSFGTSRGRTGYLFAVVTDAGRQSPLEDRSCMLCDGDGQVDCPVRGCSRGKIRVTKQTVVATNPITGQPIINSTTVPVPCQNCSAQGHVECQRCDGGIDKRLQSF